MSEINFIINSDNVLFFQDKNIMLAMSPCHPVSHRTRWGVSLHLHQNLSIKIDIISKRRSIMGHI